MAPTRPICRACRQVGARVGPRQFAPVGGMQYSVAAQAGRCRGCRLPCAAHREQRAALGTAIYLSSCTKSAPSHTRPTPALAKGSVQQPSSIHSNL